MLDSNLFQKSWDMCYVKAQQDYDFIHLFPPAQTLKRRAVLQRIIKEGSLRRWHLIVDFDEVRESNQTMWGEKRVLRAEGRVKYKKSAGKNERIRDFKKAVFLKWKWPMDKRAGRKFRSQQRARPYMCALGSFVQSLMGIHCLWWVGEWQDLDLLLFLIF